MFPFSMKITFTIKYDTTWGQYLCLVGSVPALGNGEEALAARMNFVGNGHWMLEIDVPENLRRIDYRYLVRFDSGGAMREWNKGHTLLLDPSSDAYHACDAWLDRPDDLPFYSSAFTRAIFSRSEARDNAEVSASKKLTIQLYAPQVKKGQYVAVSGDQDLLGHWQPEQAIRMDDTEFPLWRITLDATKLTFPFAYKFLIGNENGNASSVIWEEGDNRWIDNPFLTEGRETAVISGLFFRFGASQPRWKGAGTVIPVFSLRSETSFGVGDLGDLRLFIDWAKLTGQSVIQVLPMNDTRMTDTWMDSYPYSAMSIYALHPMYLNLYRMGRLKNEERRNYYDRLQHELNAYDEVHYEAVVRAKLAYCREYIEQEGLATLLADENYIRFYEKNKSWLVPYAAYSYLRERCRTADFNQWENFAVYDRSAVAALCAPSHTAYPEIAFQYYLQYVLDKQFREVTAYARAQGIALKGDLPIGVNRNSVEVWTEPDYFNLTEQSGAPPDDFSTFGQNWLFPTYRWDVMEKDNYTWWRNRFAKMNDYFDSFRIDHILGFFRIWEIPEDYVQGLCGHFNPALPLSVYEIEETGLDFDVKRFTSPRIHEMYLYELFGDYKEEVMGSYLAQSSSHHYVLKSFCDTQRKIKALFDGRDDEKSVTIRQGLYYIANEVLFLEDPRQEGFYHPRISASQSFLYKELREDERRIFDQLYEDFFYHRHNQFWKEQALTRLTPLVESTRMLVCGEDLGMIPATVPEVMNHLRLLSLEIERMPKASGVEFADLNALPYFAVCTTSTHDMSPLRSWWHEDTAKIQRYYHQVLHQDGEAPEECSADLATLILGNHLSSPAMLVIIPWQDWMAIDDTLKRPDADAERINVPAQTNFFWRYRIHLTIEKLLDADELNKRISELISQHGR